jgi:hypothetical protein
VISTRLFRERGKVPALEIGRLAKRESQPHLKMGKQADDGSIEKRHQASPQLCGETRLPVFADGKTGVSQLPRNRRMS